MGKIHFYSSFVNVEKEVFAVTENLASVFTFVLPAFDYKYPLFLILSSVTEFLIKKLKLFLCNSHVLLLVTVRQCFVF